MNLFCSPEIHLRFIDRSIECLSWQPEGSLLINNYARVLLLIAINNLPTHKRLLYIMCHWKTRYTPNYCYWPHLRENKHTWSTGNATHGNDRREFKCASLIQSSGLFAVLLTAAAGARCTGGGIFLFRPLAIRNCCSLWPVTVIDDFPRRWSDDIRVSANNEIPQSLHSNLFSRKPIS